MAKNCLVEQPVPLTAVNIYIVTLPKNTLGRSRSTPVHAVHKYLCTTLTCAFFLMYIFVHSTWNGQISCIYVFTKQRHQLRFFDRRLGPKGPLLIYPSRVFYLHDSSTRTRSCCTLFLDPWSTLYKLKIFTHVHLVASFILVIPCLNLVVSCPYVSYYLYLHTFMLFRSTCLWHFSVDNPPRVATDALNIHLVSTVYSLQSTVYSLQFTVYSLQSTIYSLFSLYTLYIIQSTVYSLQSTVYSLQSTVYSLQSTVYSLQSTVYSLQSTVYSLQSTVYSLQSTVYSLQSTVYSLQSTVYSLQSTVYSLQSTVYSLQSTVYSLQSTVYSLQSTVYNLQPTVYSLQSTVYSIQYTVHSLQSTVYSLQSTVPHFEGELIKSFPLFEGQSLKSVLGMSRNITLWLCFSVAYAAIDFDLGVT